MVSYNNYADLILKNKQKAAKQTIIVYNKTSKHKIYYSRKVQLITIQNCLIYPFFTSDNDGVVIMKAPIQK